MDAKITKKRLSELLSYDWLKILCLGILGIFLWSLIFTMFGPGLNKGQTFQIIALDVYEGSEVQTYVNKLKKDYLTFDEKDVLSYDIMEMSLTTYQNDNTQIQAYTTRMSAQEGDILITSHETLDDKGNKIPTVYEMSVDNGLIKNLDDTIEDAISKYSNLTDKEIETMFFKRNKKDNRYKTKESISSGIIQEKIRIEKVLSASFELKKVLKENPNFKLMYKRGDATNATAETEDKKYKNPDLEPYCYGINLHALTNANKLFMNVGSTKAENIALGIMSFSGEKLNGDLFYDAIVFVNDLIKNYK